MLELNKIYNMDCIEGMKLIPDNSIDSIVTDPPYEIGFMGKWWDSTGIANNVDMRKECLRVLKPWWHLLSFAATRTYHRMTCAIEDAGFEVRDMIEWVYGSGFPKSLNIGKAVDKIQGNERKEIEGGQVASTLGSNTMDGGKANPEYKYTKGTSEWEGWGTALKPAHEPICMARKPLGEKTIAENVLKYGTGGINIDESRVGMSQEDKEMLDAKASTNNNGVNFDVGEGKAKGTATPANNLGRFPANLIHDNSEEVRECFPDSKSKGHFPSNNKNGNSIFNTNNLEQEEQWLEDSGNASRFFKSIIYQAKASKSERNAGCEKLEETETVVFTNRKAGRCPIHDKTNPSGLNTYSCGCPIQYTEQKKEVKKNTNNHPTVKPTALMEYLIKMVTKEWWTVLDPFTWSWTTLVAAKRNLYNYIWFELSKEYCDIIEARLKSVQVWLF